MIYLLKCLLGHGPMVLGPDEVQIGLFNFKIMFYMHDLNEIQHELTLFCDYTSFNVEEKIECLTNVQ